MQTTTKKVLVHFVEGEMVNCYDTSCDGCNGPDCFLNEGLIADSDLTRKDPAFCYAGNSVNFSELLKPA
jgi:hypothetical protein